MCERFTSLLHWLSIKRGRIGQATAEGVVRGPSLDTEDWMSLSQLVSKDNHIVIRKQWRNNFHEARVKARILECEVKALNVGHRSLEDAVVRHGLDCHCHSLGLRERGQVLLVEEGELLAV